MYVCMYVCTYVCVCVCNTYVCICVRMYIRMYAYVYGWMDYGCWYMCEESGVRGSGRSGWCFARGQGGLVCRPTEYQQEHIQALQAQAKAFFF